MIEIVIGIVFGFVAGLLVARNNIDKLNVIIEDAQSLVEKSQKEIRELRQELTKKKKKAPVKKPQVD